MIQILLAWWTPPSWPREAAGAGGPSIAWRKSRWSAAGCVLDQPFLRPCRRERLLEDGLGAGHLASPYSQGSAFVFLLLTQDLAEIPNCLLNRYKVSPLQSQLRSSHVPVCDAIYTSPIPTAPSKQLASPPHWVFGSLLSFALPVLGSSLRRKTTGLDRQALV